MKAIIKSENPRVCANILNLIQSLIISKSCPKEWKDYLEGKTKVKPKPIDVYIYCTKEDSLIKLQERYKDRYVCEQEFRCDDFPKMYSGYEGKGEVVAKFMLNKVEEIKPSENFWFDTENGAKHCYYCQNDILEDVGTLHKNSCLCGEDMFNYLRGKTGYAWHIDNLEIFNESKELFMFKPYCRKLWLSNECRKCKYYFFPRNPVGKDECLNIHLTKAPTTWCYVEVEK